MTDLVSPLLIESIVGVERHPLRHYGFAASAQRRVYILHSKACLASGRDLRDCRYSLALDRHGIDPATWPERRAGAAVVHYQRGASAGGAVVTTDGHNGGHVNCTSGFYCERCEETVVCARPAAHKGFHQDGTDLSARHTWDEYAEVEHI